MHGHLWLLVAIITLLTYKRHRKLAIAIVVLLAILLSRH